MTDWHGYPLESDRHPARPWWRGGRDPHLAAIWWIRADGSSLARMTEAVAERRRVESEHFLREGETEADALARIDRTHPLPAPEPKVGQVWVWATGEQGAIVGVRPDIPVIGQRRTVTAIFGCPIVPMLPDGMGHTDQVSSERWPPEGAVLVAGPLAPWGPA